MAPTLEQCKKIADAALKSKVIFGVCHVLRYTEYTRKLKAMLDAVHDAMVAAYEVPVRDRYQVLNEHKPSRMVIEDTGHKFVLIQVTTRPRSTASKEKFYRLVVEALEQTCGIAPNDVMINHVTCSDEDWSFGFGRAQFLTGEL